MRRLTYTPKVYVFVKDKKGRIHDLSSYVVAGSVSRKIDQVSSASVTLRNPKMIFTAKLKDGKRIQKPTFSPMDPITIFLERAPGKPVRVFTGFLDTTPYLQFFPGVIELKASCTLKRLLHTYFDPGLPYTQDFLTTYGWIPMGGTRVSDQAFNEFKQLSGSDKYTQPPKKEGEVDGSLANLLYATLKHIGRWPEDTVYIEPLQPAVFDRLVALSAEFIKNNEEASSKALELYKKLIGAGAVGDPGDSGDSATPTGQLAATLQNIVPVVQKYATKYNVPAEMVMAVIGVETDFGQNLDESWNKYKGWFQMDVDGGGVGSYLDGPWRYRNPGGHPTKADAMDLGLSTNAFCAAAAGRVRREPNLKNDLLAWAMKVQGVNGSNNPRYPDTWDSFIKKSKQYLSQYGSLQIPGGGMTGNLAGNSGGNKDGNTDTYSDTRDGDTDQTERADRSGGKNKDATTEKIYRPIEVQGTITSPWGPRDGRNHNAVDYGVPSGTRCQAPTNGTAKFMMETGFGKDGGMVHFKFDKDTGDIKAGTTIGWGHIEGVPSTLPLGKEVKVVAGQFMGLSGYQASPHVHFVMHPPGGGGFTTPDGGADPGSLLTQLQKEETTGITGGGGPTSPDGGSPDGATPGDPNGLGPVFFGAFEFPSLQDSTEATLLGGEKSLMNDKPLLPFIQQLCNASLRHFQSLPDGRFYAFFPDYFGEMKAHPPYWLIDDIEILDGKIDLTDDALVTHMYVVGDTTSVLSGSTGGTFPSLTTAGVVTVYNMFLADSVLNRTNARKAARADAAKKTKKEKKEKWADLDPAGMGIPLDLTDVRAFLQKYGARPQRDDMPMIRSPYYEMFLAYQRFLLAWSRQFSSYFSFTFMPELFPGGKVGFPDHALQMYIEEVEHSWNYESGFLTNAILSAPSVWSDKSNKTAAQILPDNMVNAIIESEDD